MRDIAQVLRRKRAQHAQLAKEIQLLEQAEVTLREVASLLADGDEEESTLLGEVEEETQPHAAGARAASAAVASPSIQPEADSRPAALRWP
jgi:hypothetical protein